MRLRPISHAAINVAKSNYCYVRGDVSGCSSRIARAGARRERERCRTASASAFLPPVVVPNSDRASHDEPRDTRIRIAERGRDSRTITTSRQRLSRLPALKGATTVAGSALARDLVPLMTASEFSGKTAVVFGATAGIGRSTALALAAAGARVVIAGLGAEEGRAVEAVRGVCCDCADECQDFGIVAQQREVHVPTRLRGRSVWPTIWRIVSRFTG